MFSQFPMDLSDNTMNRLRFDDETPRHPLGHLLVSGSNVWPARQFVGWDDHGWNPWKGQWASPVLGSICGPTLARHPEQ